MGSLDSIARFLLRQSTNHFEIDQKTAWPPTQGGKKFAQTQRRLEWNGNGMGAYVNIY